MGQQPSLYALEFCKPRDGDLSLKLFILMVIILVSGFGVVVVICFCLVVFRVIRAHLMENRVQP